MNTFTPEIVKVLAEALDEQHIDSVTMSSYGLSFQFCDVTISCTERVTLQISG